MEMVQVLSALLFSAVAYPLLLILYTGTLNDASKRKNAFYLCAVVLGIALAAKMYYDASTALPVNYYTVMDVTRQSEMMDIRKSYKALSKKYHPDKNPSPEAETVFQMIKSAYDVLMDEQLRDLYNRFGPNSLTFDPRKDELKLISDIAIKYIFWGLVAFVMTLPPSARACRVWISILGIALMSLEVCFSLTGSAMPAWMMPATLTEYELVFYLHSAFPVLVSLLSALAMSLSVDIDLTTSAVLKDVLGHHKAVHDVLQEMDSVVEIAGKPLPSTTDLERVEEVRKRLIALRGDMEVASDSFSNRIEDLRAASSNPGSNYYWILFVLLYGGIYFLQ